MEQDRLGAADMVLQVAIARGLARLLLQLAELAFQRDDDVVEAREIGFGGLQAQFGFMSAGMQAGDAGCFFEQRTAVGGLGVDDGTDAALAHQGGRMGTGRDVGEQQLHVAGAGFLAVDLVGRAFAAIDAARDFEVIAVVELGGSAAIGIVEGQHHFGDVARRPAAAAAEDDIVHLAAAHALGRSFAHHPTQRLDQVRLAAAIGADDPGHPGLNRQLRGFDEGFEAGQADFVELDQGKRSLTGSDLGWDLSWQRERGRRRSS